jgi:DNA-binding MarR family transcriptional regulator
MQASCCSEVMCESSDCLQLTEREAQVCMAVWTSPEPVAFSTVKKTLGYHQEVTSRILKRLINYGAIEKFRGRYRRVSQ